MSVVSISVVREDCHLSPAVLFHSSRVSITILNGIVYSDKDFNGIEEVSYRRCSLSDVYKEMI